MKIYISKEGKKTGPLTEKEIKGMIWAGILTLEDLARKEGETDWKPLRVLLDNSQEPAIQTSSAPVQVQELQEKKNLVDSTVDFKKNIKEVKEDEVSNSIDKTIDDIKNVNEEKEVQEKTRSENRTLPFSVKVMFSVMVVVGILMTVDGLLIRTFLKGNLSTLEQEGWAESPIAGRLGSICGSIVLSAVLFWLPGYFILKRGKKTLYFCMTMSILAIAIFIYVSFKVNGILFLYLDSSNLINFSWKVIAYVFLPVLTLYIWFRHRSIFHKKKVIKVKRL